jgi:hypothetical protein
MNIYTNFYYNPEFSIIMNVQYSSRLRKRDVPGLANCYMLKCVLLHNKHLELVKKDQAHVLEEIKCVRNFSGKTFRNLNFGVSIRRYKVIKLNKNQLDAHLF